MPGEFFLEFVIEPVFAWTYKSLQLPTYHLPSSIKVSFSGAPTVGQETKSRGKGAWIYLFLLFTNFVYTIHLRKILQTVTIPLMDNLKISADVLHKLQHKHAVTRDEVEQCFANRSGKLLRDTREKHKTNPPTLWFLAFTNKLRLLKIVYIQIGNTVELKSAFSPIQTEIDIYSRHG